MTEVTICGRGGQGGVTLAKLIATSYFLQGKDVQAFGVYAAERSGAPLQAFVRIDDEEITNHNQIKCPDHVIVLDRTLISPGIAVGAKSSGWIVLNTPQAPEDFAELFPGRQVATVDATSLAVSHKLGTRSVPIVNTTMLGAIGEVFGITLEEIEASLAELRFGEPNVTSARQAFQQVRKVKLSGHVTEIPTPQVRQKIAGLLDEDQGLPPKIKTGSWATQQPERRQLTPPCNDGCPAGNDVRAFVEAVGKKNYSRALEILLETSPLPGVCGRVCPAPCMEACNRSELDESVNIRDLERYAAEHGEWPVATTPWRSERIAVIGSGPAGLSAAYQLAKQGYRVTIFEAGKQLGGVMRTGIPAYRLPPDILDYEISHILDHGVEAITGCKIDRKKLLELSHEFAALFVGTGLQNIRTADLGTEANDAVQEGIEFLDRARLGEERCDDERVIVVGGGNTAMDASRTAQRLGAKSVRVIYRRTRDDMPAISEEIAEALEEGVIIEELVSPIRITPMGSGVGLLCQRMRLGEPDESGRPRPIPETTDDAFFEMPCDRVILALGQSHDLSILPEGAELKDGDTLVGLFGAPIFSGGDFAGNDGTVSAAIGSGHKAALHIHQTLSGDTGTPSTTNPVAEPNVIHMNLFNCSVQAKPVEIPMNKRRSSFAETKLGLRDLPGVSQAAMEAQRCFNCGTCNSCNRCMDYCPEGIVYKEGGEYRFDYSYCKGCGLCSTQCPRGVIYMSEL